MATFHPTLPRGTRVATIVDTELAESWNPLVKSNPQARMRMAATDSDSAVMST